MGCCQSTTATRAAANGRGAAAPAAGAAVLTEVPVHERCIAELKRIFEGVNANEQGQANKTELAASVEKEANLDALLKESQMSAIIDFVNRIVRHEGDFVSWEEFMQFARVAVAEEVVHEAKEAVVQEVKHEVEEFKQDMQNSAEELKQDVQHGAEVLKQEVQHAVEEVKKEAQHEADEFTKDIAADVAAGRKALSWLKERFESLVADEGAVSKGELASKLKESEDVDGQSIGELVGQAGFNPLWNAFEGLDTNKDGCISWEEFKEHVCGEKEVDEEVDALVDETMVTQRCWGCC